MIIRGTPKNINDYIKVDKYKSYLLHKSGFIPLYIDKNGIYYKKNKYIEDFLLNQQKDGTCREIAINPS